MSDQPKTVSAAIIRIEDDLLRIVLWTVWFPFLAIEYAALSTFHTWKAEIGFWNRFFQIGDTLTVLYQVGLNGIKKG
jgi:hypothetical protein